MAKPAIVHKVKHKKKLTDEAKAIASNPTDDPRFTIYTKRVLGCFANLDLFPEIDIDDALESLNIISEGRMKRKFFASNLFASLVKQVLNFSKEVPPKIRKAIVPFVYKP